MLKPNDVPPLAPFLGICRLIAGKVPPSGPTEEDTRQAVFALVRSFGPTEGTVQSLGHRLPAQMNWASTEAKSDLRGIPGQRGWFHFRAFDGQEVLVPVHYMPDQRVWVVLPEAAEVVGRYAWCDAHE